jgi:hypothetical protein
MSSAEHVIKRIKAAGGELAIHGERIRCRLPEEANLLLEDLRSRKEEVLLVLRRRVAAPVMPPGIRLVSWNLKNPPVLIETSAVVTDPALFAKATLEQLRVALGDPKRWVGWSVAQLIERLAQVGVSVMFEKDANIR